MQTLCGKVAVVTGASRGAGRAIAAVLGEAGATVYVTGRTVRGGAEGVDKMPGTIEDAAEEVTARGRRAFEESGANAPLAPPYKGGEGIAVRCDHTVDADVAALFERVKSEAGRLDVLVNNAWGGYEGLPTGIPRVPFWEQPRVQWDGMFVAGVRATIVASQLAVPLMIASRNKAPSPSPLPEGDGKTRGLIVNTVAWAYDEYLGSMFYDASKAAIVRVTGAMARDLKPHGVAAIALAPGFMRTERVMAAHAAHPFDLSWTESPEYLGRAVQALAEDGDAMRHSGQVVTVGDLAREYGFTDVDGKQPAGFRMPKQ